ncbi:Abi family protein [Fibrobacter sp. HC4]|uniref:Abi family protein n=1 Tax=Fibrobacter sp. HC4 TaxID=3239812 RepID=UPI0020195400|nr:Abi family protein [Fibrobacter succinogenes]MCL4101229.1 hypothetical protein [Fibrobacter succinogenes]
MSPRIYSKPPQTLDQQAQLLISRGLKDVSKDELVEVRKHWSRSRGILSKTFSNLKSNLNAKTEVAKYFGFNKASTKVLVSWFQHLNLVRNICAHYSRLFTRSFIVRPMIPTNKPAKWVDSIPSQDRIYFSICIITTLLDVCAPNYDFRGKLKQVMKMVRPEQLPSLGFPENWGEQDLFA